MVVQYRTTCKYGGFVRNGTIFVRPFDIGGTRRFVDRGTYSFSPGRGRVARARVLVRGRLRPSALWTGDYRIKLRITDDGRFVTRCRVGKTGWSARRVG